MTEWLLALVPEYGVWLLFAITFVSCLALPVPSSLAMLTAGGFSAAGDMGLPTVMLAALTGAVVGDQTGFALGRIGGPAFLDRVGRGPKRRAALDRARALLARRGGIAVFLTRWLFSPVGPWANFASGAGGLDWARFTLAGVLGEAVWVVLYTGTGHVFAGNLVAASDILGSALGLLGALAAALGLGLWLRAMARQHG
ncbi:VTT domain-containing protein [Defluviimonas sp. WL0050]|uniref:VTT domain-containing protein n=1 Tax=Albidovulum litorale TaxID=2984134 RepID=A0ABT2ZPT0_9RHOB|nr:VTT domain-containing protein [Defluviimonas sp. WL0050]MCV2873117.1 VTT domain-containing protein [Defluviimonas sp. WL0050]